MDHLKAEIDAFHQSIEAIHYEIVATYGDTRKADLIAKILYRHYDNIRDAAQRVQCPENEW